MGRRDAELKPPDHYDIIVDCAECGSPHTIGAACGFGSLVGVPAQCADCLGYVYDTPSGPCCARGHGAAGYAHVVYDDIKKASMARTVKEATLDFTHWRWIFAALCRYPVIDHLKFGALTLMGGLIRFEADEGQELNLAMPDVENMTIERLADELEEAVHLAKWGEDEEWYQKWGGVDMPEKNNDPAGIREEAVTVSRGSQGLTPEEQAREEEWQSQPDAPFEALMSTLPAKKLKAGVKYDQDKAMASLLPPRALLAIADVLTFGAVKYEIDNWKKVKDAEFRYKNALFRHLYAWQDGERVDPESGLHHLAHAGCCLLFLLWFETRTEEEIAEYEALTREEDDDDGA